MLEIQEKSDRTVSEEYHGLKQLCGSPTACSAGRRTLLAPSGPSAKYQARSPENYGACSSFDQNSSRNLGGWSMPKNEEGFPCTSRSLFTKAVNEETQFPIK